MESPITERHIAANLQKLSQEAAKEICTLLSGAIARKGSASFVLCGGRTPTILYRLLASEFKNAVEWDRVDFFWGDERYVDQNDDQSNFRLASESLLAPLEISSIRIHPMPTTFDDPADAAASYEEILRHHFRSPTTSFDVLLLGMGADGHVASIFPGNKSALEGMHLVDVTRAPLPPTMRLTLTLRSINNADSIFILVAGREKREILQRLRGSEDRGRYPVSSVTGRKRLVWFVDRDAAGIEG